MGAKPALHLGLMSGTSLDGVDAALVETDGERLARPGAALTLPYDDALSSIGRSGSRTTMPSSPRPSGR
jgi:1,6-anhydro-N-acetylmuramate kinase